MAKFIGLALHYAKSKELRELLVESVDPAKRRDFLLIVLKDQGTTLHLAAATDRTDVVRLLCNIHLPDDFLLKKDKYGQTALHYAKSKEVAQLLVESVYQIKRRSFILTVDEDQLTALHAAAVDDSTDVVEYLCSIHLPDDELLLNKDKYGKTVLHYAKSKEVAQLLVESVDQIKQRGFLLATDEDQYTALHTAVLLDRTDVVEYLCSKHLPDDELLLKKDKCGKTALHRAKSKGVAQLLVKSVKQVKQRGFILTVDENQVTALHIAAQYNRTDLVEYLCSPTFHAIGQLSILNRQGETALHNAATGDALKLMLDAVDARNELSHLLEIEDLQGNTVVLSLARQGRGDSLAYLLSQIVDLYDSQSDLTRFFQKRNNYGQNIFHLAALSLAIADLYNVLLDYIRYMDVETMMIPDIYNNTPIHYVAAKYATKIFADFLLRLPLVQRQRWLKLKNRMSTNCKEIINQQTFAEKYYLQMVLCDETQTLSYSQKFKEHGYFPSPDVQHQLEHPEQHYTYDENILKVLKYALNEYSLLDSTYRLSHRLFSSAAHTHSWILLPRVKTW